MDEPSQVKFKEVEKVDDTSKLEDDKDLKTSAVDENTLMKFLMRHWASIAVIIYVLSPIDIIPDFIPIAGSVDDALLLAYQLFQEYRAYRSRNPKS